MILTKIVSHYKFDTLKQKPFDSGLFKSNLTTNNF
ncbi:hypothetical protein MTsN2n4_18370 [Pseudoalteromonas sp. MTN2-4]